jgi:antitoxin ParD1/3/4
VPRILESVAEGVTAIEPGEGIKLTAELMEERGRRAMERAQCGERPHRDVFSLSNACRRRWRRCLSMSVTLTPQVEDQIRHWVDSGQYPDADAVLRQALRLLEEQEQRRERLRAELQPAVEQAKRGELIDFTPERFEEIKQRAIDGARQGKPVRDAVKP